MKWGEQIPQMDTSILQVEGLGDEHVKQEVGGSSVGGREARVFRAKNCVTQDWMAIQWGPSQ
jgi:hypothetical protein